MVSEAILTPDVVSSVSRYDGPAARRVFLTLAGGEVDVGVVGGGGRKAVSVGQQVIVLPQRGADTERTPDSCRAGQQGPACERAAERNAADPAVGRVEWVASFQVRSDFVEP